MEMYINHTVSNGTNSTYSIPENAMTRAALIALPVASVIVVINIITITVLFRCKHMINQIRIISINLAITDVLTGLYTVIDSILNIYNQHNVFVWCVIRCHLDIGLITASLFFMNLLAFDRLLSLKFDMRYNALVTENKIKLSAVLTWLFAFVVTVLTYMAEFQEPVPCVCFDNESFSIITLASRNLSFLFIGISYLSMFCTIRKQNRKIANYNHSKGQRVNVSPVAKLTVIVGTLFVMYFPKNFYMIYMVSKNIKLKDNFRTFIITAAVERLNSFINPFLYVWRFRECRIIILKFLGSYNEKIAILAKRMEYELTGSYMMNQEKPKKQPNVCIRKEETTTL